MPCGVNCLLCFFLKGNTKSRKTPNHANTRGLQAAAILCLENTQPQNRCGKKHDVPTTFQLCVSSWEQMLTQREKEGTWCGVPEVTGQTSWNDWKISLFWCNKKHKLFPATKNTGMAGTKEFCPSDLSFSFWCVRMCWEEILFSRMFFVCVLCVNLCFLENWDGSANEANFCCKLWIQAQVSGRLWKD